VRGEDDSEEKQQQAPTTVDGGPTGTASEAAAASARPGVNAFQSAADAIQQNKTLVGITAAATVALGVLLRLWVARRQQHNHRQQQRVRAAQLTNGAAAGGAPKKKRRAAGSGSSSAAAPPKLGPLSKLKPSANMVPLADGSLAVVRRPIAADHSCLFNSVGYCMHQSKSRAPFLRRVVSNEVSGDPDTWSAAFLGMTNAAYCAWITEPQNWGGGIELAILAAHYRREIAAWNIETGEPHVFGEERGE